jgi:type I restriction enzyme, S subunit
VIADLKPYGEYKESDAPWFGDVPRHWEVKRLGSVFAERSETNEKYEIADVLSVLKDIGVIPYSEKGRIGNKKSDDIGRYKVVRPDDLVVNCMNVIIGSVGRSRYTGCLSPVYYVLKRRQQEHLPRYLELVFQHKSFQRSLVRIGNGILAHRMRIPMEKLKAELFLLPPPVEQAAIVRFLDWANGRLERAIRAKRKVIALLNEQKQAIIHRAVTRGLDPSVPLKPSGVPWLGDIPQHWEVVPLKYLCRRIQNGATPSTSEQRYYIGGTVPWFGPSSIGMSSELGVPVRHLTTAAFDDGRARLICGPALLVIVIGATAGKMGLLPGDGATNQQITAFELLQGAVAPDFVVQQLRSSEPWLKSTASTATIPILDSGIVNRLPVAVPPVSEQERILSALFIEALPLTTAISRLEREIDLHREYRTRLVADVVTGKLDVRDAAERLPDEAQLEAVEHDADLGDEAETADEEVAA